MKSKTTGLLAASLVCAATLGAAAAHAKPVSLRVGDSFPVGHYIPENMTKFWMKRVAELTDNGVRFDYYPAEQLGKAKDTLSLTQTGVLDIGYVGPSYVSDKMPLSSVAELPESFTTSCQGTKAFWQLAKPGGALDKVEFAPNGVRVLLALVLPPYQVMTSKAPLSDLASLRNLKLRTTGGAKEIATVKVGAVPVQISAPETRDALTRGTIDGILFPHSSVLPYDLHPQLKYGTQDVNFGSFVVTYMISQDRWKALPANVQQAFDKASEEAVAHACQIADQFDAKDKQTIADSGVRFVSFPKADADRLMGLMGEVSNQWATDLDKRGKPGSDVLKAFRDTLVQAN